MVDIGFVPYLRTNGFPLVNLLTFMSVGGRMEGASYKLVWPLRITAEPDNKTTYGDTNPT